MSDKVLSKSAHAIKQININRRRSYYQKNNITLFSLYTIKVEVNRR